MLTILSGEAKAHHRFKGTGNKFDPPLPISTPLPSTLTPRLSKLKTPVPSTPTPYAVNNDPCTVNTDPCTVNIEGVEAVPVTPTKFGRLGELARKKRGNRRRLSSFAIQMEVRRERIRIRIWIWIWTLGA